MITVENDWVEYTTVPVRAVAVRGGAACAQRTRVVAERSRPAVPVRSADPARPAPTARTAAVATAQARPPRAAVAPAARAPQRRLRLTRRGRLVLVVLPAVLGVTAALVSLTAPLAQAQPSHPDRTIVVGTGDSLWSIAVRVAPTADPRDVVADLERANHLPSATVQAGQRLVLPVTLAG